MKRAVRHYGFDVLEATDGEEALATAEHLHPHLIVTEEALPDFYELMERLREHPTLRDVPIVIINPDAEDDTRYAQALVLTDYDQLEHLLAPTVKTINQK